MNDWNSWINSSETRTALRILKEELLEQEQNVIDGYLLQHSSADQIAVDYAHKVGAIQGFKEAIEVLIDIRNRVEEEDERS